MTSDPISAIAEFIFRPKVVHSLPGRMRVHLPGLKQLDRHSTVAREILEEFSTIFPGVEKFSLNAISGNILIEYDVKATNETTIVSSIVTIIKTALANRKHLARIKPANQTLLLKRLMEYLSSVDASALKSEMEIVLPDEIWS